MYSIPHRGLAQIFTLLTYAVAAAGILVVPFLTQFVTALSWSLLILVLILCCRKQTTPHLRSKFVYLQLWLIQTIGFIALFSFMFFWLQLYPSYADTSSWTTQHLSLNFLLETLAFATLLILLTQRMQATKKMGSIMLFFPGKKITTLGAVCMNFWFRHALIVTSLLMIFFSMLTLLSKIKINFHINDISALLSLLLAILLCRTRWFYQCLQIFIKRWRLNFAKILFLMLAALFCLALFFSWMTQPLNISSFHVNFQDLGKNAPLIIFWGVACCLSVPLGFLASATLPPLKSSRIFLCLLTNPVLWILIIVDFKHPLLPLMQHCQQTFLILFSILVLISSLIWLGSKRFSALSMLCLMEPEKCTTKIISRVLAQDYLQMAFFILFAIKTNALFLLQILLLATGGWIFLIYWIIGGHYYLIIRKNL